MRAWREYHTSDAACQPPSRDFSPIGAAPPGPGFYLLAVIAVPQRLQDGVGRPIYAVSDFPDRVEDGREHADAEVVDDNNQQPNDADYCGKAPHCDREPLHLTLARRGDGGRCFATSASETGLPIVGARCPIWRLTAKSLRRYIAGMQVSKLIADLRGAGLKQTEIALRAGIAQSTVSELGSGQRGKRIGYDTAKALLALWAEVCGKRDRPTLKR